MNNITVKLITNMQMEIHHIPEKMVDNDSKRV